MRRLSTAEESTSDRAQPNPPRTATTDCDGHTTGWAWTTDTDHDCPKETA